MVDVVTKNDVFSLQWIPTLVYDGNPAFSGEELPQPIFTNATPLRKTYPKTSLAT